MRTATAQSSITIDQATKMAAGARMGIGIRRLPSSVDKESLPVQKTVIN
jgi:hypothetical protein